jgi:hypothetical protein
MDRQSKVEQVVNQKVIPGSVGRWAREGPLGRAKGFSPEAREKKITLNKKLIKKGKRE